MGKQGKTATNKVNIINMIKELIYLGIPSNMACFCKLMAQNWHKSFALVRATKMVLPNCTEYQGLIDTYMDT